MSLVIGCDSFLSVRNVRLAGLPERLSPHSVIVLVAPEQLEGSRKTLATRVEPLERFEPTKDPLGPLLRKADARRKCAIDPRTQWAEARLSSARNNVHKPLRRKLSIARAALRVGRHYMLGHVDREAQRRRVVEALETHPTVRHWIRWFEAEGIRAVAGFSPEGYAEVPLMEAARVAGLRTAIMIRSRDNLMSKILHLPDAERYFVWSEAMKGFLLQMYPSIDPSRVRVTGSPQFDRHVDPARRLTRETFFAQMGLDPARPLVVYTMATPGLIDHEVRITQGLAEAAHHGRLARGAQLLVRGHPRMFGSNVPLLIQEYPEARVWPRPTPFAYRSAEHEAQMNALVGDDEAVHLSTLAYQDVQVNVCGTMTIDSAIFDKPVVNIYYDQAAGVPRDLPEGLSIRRFYERTDVKDMMSYGASRLVYSEDDCIRTINAYLEDPTRDQAGRRRAREQDCGVLDGKASERIAAELRELLDG